MDDDKRASVARRFPLLFADMQEDHDIALGFEVGDGWIPLLERLFEQLETLIAAEPVKDQPNYRAVQIKEKFGGLRVYLALAGTLEMEKAISEAEAESFRTCEVCAKPGEGISINGWMLTRCDEHRS